MNSTRALLVALAGAALLLGAAVAWPESATSAADRAEEGITVSATGSVDAVPDRAGLVFGVTANGATSEAALAANSTRMNRLVEALREAGIPKAKIRTQSVSVGQRYGPLGERVDGFTAENSVSVDVAASRAGEIVDLAVGAGATNVNGPTFDRTDRDTRYNAALAAAVEQARVKAEALARAANVAVGDVTRIVEGAEGGPVVWESAARTSKVAPDTPIEPGTEEISASVTVTFAVS